MSSEAGARGGAGQGPRAVEEALLDEVATACAEAAAKPERLAEPLRVVVPSEALRVHLSARLLDRSRIPLLGLKVQTTASAASELLEHAGESPLESHLFAVAVRVAARRETVLASELDNLEDGYAAVVAAVDDLLDAGFRSEHAEPLAEVLGEEPLGPGRARAEALLRVAAATAREIETRDLGHRSARFARAAERLRDEGASALPTRALWLHGFADATGVQLDWLEALRSVLGAAVWIDLPGSSEWRFGARLRERLVAAPADAAALAPGSRVVKSTHTDREAEARAAARWAHAHLEAGVAAERIAVVARDLSTHRLALRRQLARAGVPFSGAQERGGALPLARRLDACWSLIERGGALPVGRWLEARADLDLAERADLRDACQVLGTPRLGDLADLDDARLAKPQRLATPRGVAADEEGAPRVEPRRVEPARLRALRDRARGALRRLGSWPAEAPLLERLAALAELGDALGWSPAGPERSALDEAFGGAERAGPRPVPRGDWPRLLRRGLARAGTDRLGGNGGGVQVLSATEARGLGFEALWLMGLERGVFPRRISEDPLLPDSLRIAMRAVLPDLPVKGEGREEERFLFAQLREAAADLQVSHAQRDERGHSIQASPLFESLEAEEVEVPSDDVTRLDTVETLAAALATARRQAGLAPRDSAPAARARLAITRELESRRRGLGPYLGTVGPISSALDPRRAAPFVTALERMAGCPWRGFLERILRVKPLPDPQGPLPEASDRRVVGNAVHQALEALQPPDGGASPWPDEASQTVIERATRESLHRDGVALAGYEVALARRARRYVEVARKLDLVSDWEVEAVESRHALEVGEFGGAKRTLRFKADREESRDGARRFTDWKTGRLKPEAKTPAGRRDQLLKLIGEGEFLQGPAYASTGALGRYVYLDPEIDDALRVVEVALTDEQREAFGKALAGLFGALYGGALPPRLRKPDRDEEPRACARCEVKQACQRGDSGVRKRLGDWADANEASGELERIALSIWQLKVGS